MTLFIGLSSILFSVSQTNIVKAEGILDSANSTTAATGITCKNGSAAGGAGITINWLPGEGSSQKTIG